MLHAVEDVLRGLERQSQPTIPLSLQRQTIDKSGTGYQFYRILAVHIMVDSREITRLPEGSKEFSRKNSPKKRVHTEMGTSSHSVGVDIEIGLALLGPEGQLSF